MKLSWGIYLGANGLKMMSFCRGYDGIEILFSRMYVRFILAGYELIVAIGGTDVWGG